GIVIGCVRMDLEVTLIDSRRRRASFLREAVRTIPLPRGQVVEGRAELVARDPHVANRAAMVIARGLRLDAFLGLAVPLLAPAGTVLAMQTPRTAVRAEEIAAAHGVRLAARHDYALPGGVERSLLFFAHGE